MTENIAMQKCRLLHNINFVNATHFFQLNSGPAYLCVYVWLIHLPMALTTSTLTREC